MFVADTMLSWAENGAANVSVWDLHNGAVSGNAASSLFGSATYGDYGILSNATSGEPAADTSFPTYYGMQMVSLVGKAGDTLVPASSSNSLLTTHAARQANGSLALMLINKDPKNTISAGVSLSGFTSTGTGTAYSYTPASSIVTSNALSAQGTSFSIAVPPYSLTTIVLAGTSSAPSPNFTLSANPTSLSIQQGGAGSATITVAPSGGFSGNVAFAATGLPAGVTAKFNPTSAKASTTLTLACQRFGARRDERVHRHRNQRALSASTALALKVNAVGVGTGPATFTGRVSSNGPWFDEDDVVLSTTAAITALKVKITVPATNVTYNGAYDTVGGQIVDSFSGGSNLVYTFTLSPGQTVGPGNFTFAAQMNGNGVTHNAATDSWTATYVAGGATYTQSGKF